jgi:hypothetical protein
MTEDRFADFRKLSFMESRIPALDALKTFVPTGEEEDPEIQKALRSKGFARWYPVEGGHEVLVPYEGGSFDVKRFEIAKGGWDHEHCKSCGATIEPMTLCWVTRSGQYVILCSECYEKMTKTQES